MNKRNEAFNQKHIDKFINSLYNCFFTGEVELNIKFDIDQKDNVLYLTYGKHKYRLTVDYEGKA